MRRRASATRRTVCVAALLLAQATGATSFTERLRSLVVDPAVVAAAAPPAAPLDRSAAACMRCHDGTLGPHVEVTAPGTPVVYTGFRSMGHPIGMRYADYAGRDPSSYQSVASLGDEITFVDGRMTCLSCHVPRPPSTSLSSVISAVNARRGCLAQGDRLARVQGRGLCTGCHIR